MTPPYAKHRKKSQLMRICAPPRRILTFLAAARSSPQHSIISASIRAAVSVSMSAHPPADSRTCCCNAVPGAFTPSMSDADSCIVACAATWPLYQWKRPTSGSYPLPAWTIRRIWSPSMSASFRCGWFYRPLSLAEPPAQAVALIKPQFEAGAVAVKRGIVRDDAVHSAVCADISTFVASLGWRVLGLIPSPIQGGDGNTEFLLGAARD